VVSSEAATDVGEPLLRALHAIHLASALSIRDELTAFVAYDTGLLTAADLPTIGRVRGSYADGAIFALRWNTLSGSYIVLICCRRGYLSP